jgi:hypothetical protein
MSISVWKFVRASRFASAITILLVLMISVLATPAAAQDRDRDVRADENTVWSVAKGVLLDPTTYAPAAVSYTATKLDWNTSQVFFQNGFVERNPRFTVTGRSGDAPISFQAGNSRILGDSLAILQISALHNAGSQVLERVLLAKNPEHRKLIKTLGWVERIAVSSYWSYTLSEQHWRQWRANQDMAQSLNLR